MKSKKYTSLLFIFAFLNACVTNSPNAANLVDKPVESVSPVVKATDKPVVTVTANPNIAVLPTKLPTIDTITNVSPVISNGEGPNSTGTKPTLPSIWATANSSTNPSGNTGSSSDIKDLATFNGKVYDSNGKPVEGATVSAKSIDPNVSWVGEAQQTVGGAYVFRNAPVGARIEITATKDGWTARSRSEVLKSNLQGDPSANVFNFGSPDSEGLTGDNIYSIQDAPEISLLKINSRQVLSAFSGDSFNGTTGMAAPIGLGSYPGGLASSNFMPSLTAVDGSNIEIEMDFSEPVTHSYVEDSFKLSSQDFEDTDSLILTKKSEGVSFIWSTDSKICTFKYNKPLIANKEGNEVRYIINFTSPFQDLAGNKAIGTRYFRFSTSQINNFAIFSVKNSN